MAHISRYGTTTGSGTVDTVTVTDTGTPITAFVVRLRSATGEVSFTYATNGNTAATPTAGGNDTFALDAARPEWPCDFGGTTAFQVKLVTATAGLKYVIESC